MRVAPAASRADSRLRHRRWAAAGRSRSKVQAVLAEVGLVGIDVLEADTANRDSLLAMCAETQEIPLNRLRKNRRSCLSQLRDVRAAQGGSLRVSQFVLGANAAAARAPVN